MGSAGVSTSLLSGLQALLLGAVGLGRLLGFRVLGSLNPLGVGGFGGTLNPKP